MAAAFASFPVRVASDKAAALSANTGVPIVSKQHRVTKALAMEASLKVVPQRIQLPKMGFRTALRTLKPFASQDNPSASLGNADRGGGPFLGPPPEGRLERDVRVVAAGVVGQLRRRAASVPWLKNICRLQEVSFSKAPRRCPSQFQSIPRDQSQRLSAPTKVSTYRKERCEDLRRFRMITSRP